MLLTLPVPLVARPSAQHEAERATPSDMFVDSVGVNVHLSYADTPYYSNFGLIRSSLLRLGLRHVRDGLIDTPLTAYYERHNELGKLGIKGLFISSPDQPTVLLQQYPTRVASSFEAYEGPNEFDISGTGNWASTLRRAVKTLYDAARSGARPSAPVLAPSLVQSSSYPELGNVSSYIDYGTLHNYFGGRNPGTGGWGDDGYGSIPWALRLANQGYGRKIVITTETGYNNNSRAVDAVPEDISAIYLPRVLLEQWRAGIARTYLYELLSVGPDDYGLLRKDGTAKPGFYAVSNLLTLMDDPGKTFVPGSLEYSITGGDSSLHHLLLQKHDGAFYLALWVEQPGYDVDKKTRLSVSPQDISLLIASTVVSLNVYQWDSQGKVTQRVITPTSPQRLTVTDHLLILRVTLNREHRHLLSPASVK